MGMGTARSTKKKGKEDIILSTLAQFRKICGDFERGKGNEKEDTAGKLTKPVKAVITKGPPVYRNLAIGKVKRINYETCGGRSSRCV